MASKAFSGPTTIAQRLELALSRELEDGEKLVWKGMKLARLEARAFAIYLFAIPWTAFALFWIAMASLATRAANGDPLAWAFPLFGVPFVVIGLGMFAKPFVPFFQRGRILFAVTDRRVLKLSLGRELTVNSVPGATIKDMTRRESADGSGTIDLSLSIDIVGYTGRKSRKLELGRVANVMAAFQAVNALTTPSS